MGNKKGMEEKKKMRKREEGSKEGREEHWHPCVYILQL